MVSATRSAVAKSSASNAVSALFISSAIGVTGAGAATVGVLGGADGDRDEFHMAMAAIARASTAMSGRMYERTPAGAWGFDATGAGAGVDGPVRGSGVATGGSGIGGVTGNTRSEGVRSSVGARRPPAGGTLPAGRRRKTPPAGSHSPLWR